MSALTKILIVLQLVFSLVVSVMLVLFISKTEDAKAKLSDLNTKYVAASAQYVAEHQMNAGTLGKNSDLQKQLVDAQNARAATADELAKAKLEAAQKLAAADNNLTDARNSNSALAATIKQLGDSLALKETELAVFRKDEPDMIKKNGELIRANQELSNQLAAAENSIKRYQEIIAQGNKATAAAPGMAPQVTPLDNTAVAAKINGQVTDVAMAAGRTHFEMPLGTKDGITVGTKMFVYRGTGYVGDATVESVTPDQSVAVVVTTKAGETVQKGDFVSTVGQ